VLAAGGYNNAVLASAELYDPRPAFDTNWQPLLNNINQSLDSGDLLTLEGWRFRGLSGASGGGTNDSPTDYPLVQFRRIDNEQVYWLLPNPTFSFSNTSFVSVPLVGFPNGHYLVTVFANGIPSNFSRITRFGPALGPPTGGVGPMYLLLLD
jgi:hypothetical protein